MTNAQRVILSLFFTFYISYPTACTLTEVHKVVHQLLQKKNYQHVLSTYPKLHRHQHILMPAMKKFVHTPGFTETLSQFIAATITKSNAAKGYLYEVETALEISQANEYKLPQEQEKIISFNQYIHAPTSNIRRQFDIITSKRFIECKRINWRHAKRCQKQFTEQQQIISELNAVLGHSARAFIVRSKHPIPVVWKRWFELHNISAQYDYYQDEDEETTEMDIED